MCLTKMKLKWFLNHFRKTFTLIFKIKKKCFVNLVFSLKKTCISQFDNDIFFCFHHHYCHHHYYHRHYHCHHHQYHLCYHRGDRVWLWVFHDWESQVWGWGRVCWSPLPPSPHYYSNIINILNYYYNLTILMD